MLCQKDSDRCSESFAFVLNLTYVRHSGIMCLIERRVVREYDGHIGG